MTDHDIPPDTELWKFGRGVVPSLAMVRDEMTLERLDYTGMLADAMVKATRERRIDEAVRATFSRNKLHWWQRYLEHQWSKRKREGRVVAVIRAEYRRIVERETLSAPEW